MKNFGEILDGLRGDGLYRSLKPSRPLGARIECGGAARLNFACNDYLGFGSDLEAQREFLKNVSQRGGAFLMSSTSSRLLGGDAPEFGEFEDFVAGVYSNASGAEKKCLMFNCGYHANSGIIGALAGARDLVLADKLVHASIIDGIRLCGAKWLRYPHNDYEALRAILQKNRSAYDNVFIVTESVFSMDGDLADISALAAIRREFDAFLYVDEAHGFGVFGGGLGLCAERGALADVDCLMCTLGKAAASQGAFAICSQDVRDMLVNRCRTFIFTTALAPINAMWSLFMFRKILAADERRTRLMRLSKILRAGVAPFKTLGDSQIVPIVFGENSAAAEASMRLWNAGIWAPPVRWPTVPKGSARLRLSVNADMDDAGVLECAKIIGGMAE